MSLHRSKVKWFDAKKGYGFVFHPDGASDVFVHYSQINSERRFKTLRTGEVVEYELMDGPKGVHAHNVTPLIDNDEIEDGVHPGGTGDSNVTNGHVRGYPADVL